MPGYRLADVEKNNLNTKYICPICELLLRDPIQTECAHFYCKPCLEESFENAAFQCRIDGIILHRNQMFEDRYMQREILALMVHCTFQDEGCTWTGEVRCLEEHATTCQFLKIPCVYEACSLLVKRGDLSDHLRRECICRPVTCRYCNNEISYNAMKEHLRLEHNHLHEEVDNLRDVADDILHEQDNLRDVVDDLRDEQRDLKAGQHDLRHRLQQMEEHLTRPAPLEYLRPQELPSYDGQLLWKISDYARRRNDAVTGQQESIYSPCFYTSRYGYKLCARLYLNGDGMGRGTHFSIFLVVMRGQYDALLRWPFTQKVTFMLLDQDNVTHLIDAFRPDPSSCSFQRPRRETNIASGCPMFCSLAELNNHAYVRDDTMFLKIIVDIPV